VEGGDRDDDQGIDDRDDDQGIDDRDDDQGIDDRDDDRYDHGDDHGDDQGPAYTIEDLPVSALDWISNSGHANANIVSVNLYSNTSPMSLPVGDGLDSVASPDGSEVPHDGEGEPVDGDLDPLLPEDGDESLAGNPQDGGEVPHDGEGEPNETLAGSDIWGVELDSGKELFFNAQGEHLHTALIDSEDLPELADDEIPSSILDWIASTYGSAPDAKVFKELSSEEGSDSFVYLVDMVDGLEAAFNRDGNFLNAHFNMDDHHEGDHGSHPEGEGEHQEPWKEEEWKPFELPQVAKDYLQEQYPDTYFFADEVEGADGTKQIIVFLDNGLDATFDTDGNHLKTVDPWEEIFKNVNPGLKLSLEGSSWGASGTFTIDESTGVYSTAGGSTPAFASLNYKSQTTSDEESHDANGESANGQDGQLDSDAGLAEGEGDPATEVVDFEMDFHEGSMLYSFAFSNAAPSENADSSVSEANLAGTDLPAGTSMTLKFTYDFGPIRYIAINGAEVTSFTHSSPDGFNPGSFSITVKTVNPPASASDPDGTVVESSFGMLVEMGGEYWYEGAIFVTDMLWEDVAQPKFTAPWDSVAAFNVAGQDGSAANFTTYLPLQLASERFGIWRPQDLAAAIVKADGSMSFIAGSTDDDVAPATGSAWTLTPYGGKRMPHGAFPGETNFPQDPEEGGELSGGELPEGEGPEEGGNPEPEEGGGENYPLTESDARTLAEQLGLQLGGAGTEFAGDYGTKGLYAYSSGNYEGMAFFGTGGTEEEMLAPIEHESKYRPSFGDLDNGGDNGNGEEGGGSVELADSFIDFDGDGLVDTFAAISFSNDAWSTADIQIGDPYLDPFANLDKSSFGSISGVIQTTEGAAPQDYGVWLINKVEGSDDPFDGEPAFIEFTPSENGAYSVKVAPGTYYIEADGFDIANDTPYKPRLYKDENGPATLTVVDGDTAITDIDFVLKAEFREFGKQRGKISGRVISASGEPVYEANIEAYPVDDEGELLTDHPVGHGWVEDGGIYVLEAPEGAVKLFVSTWDNSYVAQELSVTITGGGLVENQDFTMVGRSLSIVTGAITNSSGNPVWAEVLFVDANDEERYIWPKDFIMEETEGAITGNFTAKIPSGDYKIYAERWDGSLIPAFYVEGTPSGAAEFDDASTVAVGDDEVTGINIQLQDRPSATITLKVEDSADSSILEWAFVAFSDPDDEWGEEEFPFLEPSQPFDGTYTAKITGGEYKIEVMVDGYEPAFYTLDASGSTAWTATEWDDGASTTLVDGETTDLGTVTLTAETSSEEDALEFLDFGDAEDAPVGGTISGTVKTPDGSAVPRAKIIAHTTDYLMWLKHVDTKSDGSFTLSKLPPGEWVIFALPPFESETYRGYQESNEIDIDLDDGATHADQTLTLTASNVAGRVMFQQKSADGAQKLVPLKQGWIWAFTDEDGDGNPDWESEDADESVEEYVEINKDGFFTLSLGSTGGYSVTVGLPPAHRASDPGAVSFTITNPSKLLKVGNAIEVSWKTKVTATGFSIERKAGTTGSYKSILSTDLASSVRSYIDTSITPGEGYTYRVTANLSSGSAVLDASDVKQTNPFIYLAPSSKTISGTVVDASGNTISGAEVFAFSERGKIETTTSSTGTYELTAGPGFWEVNIAPAFGGKAAWVYDGFEEEVEFSMDSATEAKTVNFEVTALGNGKVTGKVLKPDGTSDWTGLTSAVFIDAFNPEGEGNFAEISADGTFEILLPKGGYEVFVWVDPAQFPTYTPPGSTHVRVKDAEVALGDLSLGSKSSKIKGKLTDASGSALPNFFVAAWNAKTGDFIDDTTNASGEYELNVDGGAWEVIFEPKATEGNTESPYLLQEPRRVKVAGDETKSLDFTVAKADSSVAGSVVDSTGNPISDLDLFVYVRNAAEGAGDFDMVNGAEADSRGKFTLNLSDGQYAVGVHVPQGSGYRPQGEVTIGISGGEVSYAEGVTALALTLLSNDAVISGTLNLNSAAITGIKGDVFAVSGSGGWEEAAIGADGTYTLTLGPGDWSVGYEIINDTDTSRSILKHASTPAIVTATAGSTVTQDFALKTAGATITGTIQDEAGTQLSDQTVYVWAYREGDASYDEYETEVESSDGTFSIKVEAGGVYEVGAYLPPQLRELDYIEPKAQTADINATGSATVSLALEKLAEDNFISGTISTSEGVVDGAFVYAYSDDGQYAEGVTASDGTYKLLVPAGSKWHVGADHATVAEDGTESIYITDKDLDADLTSAFTLESQDIVLSTPDFTVPDGAANVFDPTKDFTTVLDDGTEVYIPANAISVTADADGNSEARFVVNPYTDGLAKNANDQPLDYGYKLELYDSSGKEISQEFAKPVTMTMAFDATKLAEDGISAGDLNISSYSSEKNAWVNATATIDEASGKILAQVDHFSSWAPTAPASSNSSTTLLDTVLTGSTALADGWYLSSWFGLFYYDTTQSDLKWVYNKYLGWVYISATDASSVWLYSTNSNLGWLWTTSTQFTQSNLYPAAYVYRSSDSRWLYYVVDQDSASATFEQNWFHQFIAGEETSTPGWIQYNE
ncbi:MAG: hypothetical protein HN675_04145, partial [Opitutae bacterium]|nr:hypothetical protein [Opitutae bacterium]